MCYGYDVMICFVLYLIYVSHFLLILHFLIGCLLVPWLFMGQRYNIMVPRKIDIMGGRCTTYFYIKGVNIPV